MHVQVSGYKGVIKWEYTFTYNVNELNQYGSYGWELVTAILNPVNGRTCYYLKRPVQPVKENKQ